MRFLERFALVVFFASNAAVAQALEPPLMVEYPLICPSCSDPQTMSVRYASDGTSILEKHASSDTPQLAPVNDDSEYLPGELVAGPMTDDRIGRIQHWEGEIGTNFIEVNSATGLRTGVRYVDEDLTRLSESPGEPSWSIDDMSVSVSEKGDAVTVSGLESVHVSADISYVKSRFKADDSLKEQESVELVYELWLSEQLPYSPLPFEYEPFKGNHVPPFMSPPVENAIVASLREQVRQYGGLVRAEVTARDETSVVEVSNARATPEPPMDKLAALPVVSSKQVSRFARPLFLTSLLREDVLNEAARGNVSIDGRTLDCRSAWKVNDAGDLVIALSAETENTTLFLARPVNGRPEPGSYGVAPRMSKEGLRAMTEEELAAHAGKFQMYGVVAGDPLPTVVTGFQQGTVTIEQSKTGAISGSARGTVSVLPTKELSDIRPGDVRISFEAFEGLDRLRFRSGESRVMN